MRGRGNDSPSRPRADPRNDLRAAVRNAELGAHERGARIGGQREGTASAAPEVRLPTPWLGSFTGRSGEGKAGATSRHHGSPESGRLSCVLACRVSRQRCGLTVNLHLARPLSPGFSHLFLQKEQLFHQL
jgi:hypothetical protein